jgi:hypothetical protein
MKIIATRQGIQIEGVGTYSRASFAAALYNKKRISRKEFEKIRRYQITDGYATQLINQNSDIFNLPTDKVA